MKLQEAFYPFGAHYGLVFSNKIQRGVDMPKANVQGLNLYYEVRGSGYPLVLIRGLGSNADH